MAGSVNAGLLNVSNLVAFLLLSLEASATGIAYFISVGDSC